MHINREAASLVWDSIVHGFVEYLTLVRSLPQGISLTFSITNILSNCLSSNLDPNDPLFCSIADQISSILHRLIQSELQKLVIDELPRVFSRNNLEWTAFHLSTANGKSF
jgi:hypothetical protein